MNREIRHYVPIFIILSLLVAGSCSVKPGGGEGGGSSGLNFSCSSETGYPPLSNYVNSIYITNTHGVSVPGPILQYGANYNLTIKFTVPIAGFPITVISGPLAGSNCGTFGTPIISSNIVTIPMTTTPSQSVQSSCRIDMLSWSFGALNGLFNSFSVTTVNSISYEGYNTNILAGEVSLNVWLNNLGNIFPWIAMFTPGYPSTIHYADYPPPAPVPGYYPPHSLVNVVFSEVMMGGTSLPINLTYERINSVQGDVFTPAGIPEINFTRSDDKGITMLTSNNILELGSEYKFTFGSTGTMDLFHNMNGNMDSTGMPLFPYISTTTCSTTDTPCIESTYWSAIANGIPNDVRAFNTSFVKIDGPYYPAFTTSTDLDFRTIRVYQAALSYGFDGETDPSVSTVNLNIEDINGNTVLNLGSTNTVPSQTKPGAGGSPYYTFSKYVQFNQLSPSLPNGVYYLVASENVHNSFDIVPFYLDNGPPAPVLSISTPDVGINNPVVATICATATSPIIDHAMLYISGNYITSTYLPSNLTSSDGYTFCFNDVSIPLRYTIAPDDSIRYQSGSYNIGVSFVDFAGLTATLEVAV